LLDIDRFEKCPQKTIRNQQQQREQKEAKGAGKPAGLHYLLRRRFGTVG
jgi:hypothetical protein